MKIALYLGSFNPFHNGHLKVIQQALSDFKMDKVVIVPTMQNPWKKKKVLDIDKRIKIIDISVDSSNIIVDHYKEGYYEEYDHGRWIEEDVPIFLNGKTCIDSIEKKLIPPYYSYSTLHALKNKYCNDEIFILCGKDTINDIPNWMNGEQIIQDYDFLICDRTKESSTEVRNRVKNNDNISDLVSSSVVDIIKNYYKN